MKISHILAASALSLALVAPAFAQDAAAPAPSTNTSGTSGTSGSMGSTDSMSSTDGMKSGKKMHMKKEHHKKMKKGGMSSSSTDSTMATPK